MKITAHVIQFCSGVLCLLHVRFENFTAGWLLWTPSMLQTGLVENREDDVTAGTADKSEYSTASRRS